MLKWELSSAPKLRKELDKLVESGLAPKIAVVKQDVQDYAIVAGVPAKQIGWACKCGEPLNFNDQKAQCGNCRSEYWIEDDRLVVMKEEL